MKRRVVVVVSVVAAVGVLGCSAAQQPVRTGPSTEGDEALAAEVMKVDEAFRLAKLKNDVTALDRLVADDYVGTNQNGNTRNKQELLALWADFPISLLTTDRFSVRFSTDKKLATVTGEQTEVNATGTDRMRFTREYVRTAQGEWRLRSAVQERR